MAAHLTVDGSKKNSKKKMHERSITALFNDIEDRTVSKERDPEALDLSKMDISKIKPELLTSNRRLIKRMSVTNKLPHGLEEFLSKGTLLMEKPSSENKNEEELANKLKEAFKDRKDGKVDLNWFIIGLRLLGLVGIEENEIGEIFSDFLKDGATEVNIDRIILDVNNGTTNRTQKLKSLLEECLGITNPTRKLELGIKELQNLIVQKNIKALKLRSENKRLQTKYQEAVIRDRRNIALAKDISSLEEDLSTAQAQYKIDLVTKTKEINSLTSTLRESENRRKGLKEELDKWIQRKNTNTPRKAKQMADEVSALNMQSFEAEKQFRENLDQVNARANKYKMKHEKLRKKRYERKVKTDSESSDSNTEVITPQSQRRIAQEKNSNQMRISPKKKSRTAARKESKKHKSSHKGKNFKNAADAFSRTQAVTSGNSGIGECTTVWNFLVSDMSSHCINLTHVQASKQLDAKAMCRRVILVDGKEHYNKKSNSKNYLFQIRSDEVQVSIAWEKYSWKYKLLINGQSFQEAQRNFKTTEK